ncbi:flagellar basal body-associated protein FliL [Undibacterium sp. Jales W-56]|uniref:flagellar basal body-associated protein FliL n=1 Tax=Undibacterium sp. Jales W-56 TaxID=2897325 RepID=UPI0021D2DA19|nr:flagellar basal body-associated protein FliL [Undibacterium sp. Jales W-56]MCU6435392.1 flagellar basal body-associated protein FliL [Undibacterium sp. Jales W-56]
MSKAPAKAAEADVVPAPAGRSKKKLIIMIAAGILVLSGVGGGAAIFLSKKNAASKDKEHKTEPVKAPVFLPLEPFTVNLQSENGDKYLQVAMTLQVQDEEQVNLIKLNNAQVRSRLLILLSSKQASEILTSEGKEKLAEEIIEQVKLPFSPKGEPQKLNGVFFTSFVIQ